MQALVLASFLVDDILVLPFSFAILCVMWMANIISFNMLCLVFFLFFNDSIFVLFFVFSFMLTLFVFLRCQKGGSFYRNITCI